MIYIPLIFFSILFFCIYKQRGFEISTFVVFLYVITSICCVLASTFFQNIVYTNVTLIPTIIYCLLVSISIIPLYQFNAKDIKLVINKNERTITVLTIMFFSGFVFTSIVYYNDILFRFSYQDWGELRNMIYKGDALEIHHLSGVLGLVERFFGFVNQASFLMFPVFFVSVCFLNKSRWFLLMCFLGTVSVVLTGILNVERSSAFKWFIMLTLNLVLFWPLMKRETKRRVFPIISFVLIAIALYFVSVTVSRFSETDRGTNGGFVTYAANPYLNFCDFYDNYNGGSSFSTKTLFPGFHTYVLKDYSGGVGFQQEMTLKSKKDCGTFYSFLGWFMLDLNQKGPFIFIIIYTLLFLIVLQNKTRFTISLYSLLCNYSLMVIPAYGCIAYNYMYGSSTYSVLFILLLVKILESFNNKKNENKNCIRIS